MPRIFKRGDIYQCWIPCPEGGTRRVSTNCTDKKAAAARAAELEREAVDPAHAAAQKAGLNDACVEFVASRERRGRATGTLHHYKVKLGHAVRLLPPRLADVDAHELERFIDARLGEGAAQTTVKKEIRAIGAMLRHAKRCGWYTRDLESTIPELEDTYRPRTRFLDPWELVALTEYLEPHRAAHVVFIVVTSARLEESQRALRDDVLEEWQVRLRGTKTEASARIVPIPRVFRRALLWALERAPGTSEASLTAGRLFLPWGNVRRDLGQACEAIGMERITPNDLRRTFATWLNAWGVAPNVIYPAMGHTSSRMIERVYGRLNPAAIAHLLEESTGGLAIEDPVQAARVRYTCCEPVETRRNASEAATPQEPDPPEETSVKSACEGAQRRNRTADTGIFKLRGRSTPRRESANLDTTRAANVRDKDAESPSSRNPGVSGDGYHHKGRSDLDADGGVVEDQDRGLRKRANRGSLGAATSPVASKVRSSTSQSSDAQHTSNDAPAEVSAACTTVRGKRPSPGPVKASSRKVPVGAVGVRLEVDGEVVAATSLTAGEPVDDAVARMRLAVGQRGRR